MDVSKYPFLFQLTRYSALSKGHWKDIAGEKDFASGSSVLTWLQQTRLLQDPLLQQGWVLQQHLLHHRQLLQEQARQFCRNVLLLRHLPMNSFPRQPRGQISSKFYECHPQLLALTLSFSNKV